MGAQRSQQALRLDARGAIDTAFYKARAERLRRGAVTELFDRVGHHIRAGMLCLRRVVAARSSMP